MTPFYTLFQNNPSLKPIANSIKDAHRCLQDVFTQGGRLFTCGNGGSAADADHVAGELLKGFALPRPLTADERDGLSPEVADGLQRALPVIPMNGFSAFHTAFSNDCSAELVYAQLLWALGTSGDALLAISTSGNSGNVVRAAEVAQARNMSIIALTGRCGGKLAEMADCAIVVPETETYRIQEFHLPIYHALCLSLESHFFGNEESLHQEPALTQSTPRFSSCAPSMAT